MLVLSLLVCYKLAPEALYSCAGQVVVSTTPVPLLNGIKTLLRIRLLAAVTMQINRNADLLPQQLGQVAAISEIHPFALPAALFLVLPFAVEHPVVSLGT